MTPRRIFRLGHDAFENAAAMCQGGHLAEVVKIIGEVRPGLTWYAADVQVNGPALVEGRQPMPQLVGDSAALVSAAGSVVQFESGVFVGVPRGCSEPRFRPGGLWTEDDEVADLCDALVELRAYDTTYLVIATNDDVIACGIAKAFAGAHEVVLPG